MASKGWTCPECGRRFTRARQSHSCVSVTEAALWPRAGRLDVELVLDRPLKAKRVSKLQSYGPARHVHWVPVSGPDEVDAELLGWLRESYALRS